MVIGPDTSRSITEADYVDVDALLTAAFGAGDEARLVRQLRADEDMWHELIKPWLGEIVGYYALSRMRAPDGWACLAPVAVLPKWQGGKMAERNPNMISGAPNEERYRSPWHFGSRMMQELAGYYEVEGLRNKIPKCVVVLGKPSFYERAGFSRDKARNLTSPYPIENTMILRLGDDAPTETLVYPKAFQKLD